MGEPLRPPQDQSHYQAGLMSARAIMFALFSRDLTGEGRGHSHHCRIVHNEQLAARGYFAEMALPSGFA